MAAHNHAHSHLRILPSDSPYFLSGGHQDKEVRARLLEHVRYCLTKDPYLQCYPLVLPFYDIAALADSLVEHDVPYDFVWSPCIATYFIQTLIYEGFVPLCTRVGGKRGTKAALQAEARASLSLTVEERARRRLEYCRSSGGGNVYVLLPKLHVSRSCLHPRYTHVGKKTRKQSSKFKLSVDQCFEEVMVQCIVAHGEDWLHPPLQRVFLEAFSQQGQRKKRRRRQRKKNDMQEEKEEEGQLPDAASSRIEPYHHDASDPNEEEEGGGGDGGEGDGDRIRVEFHSIEIWHEDRLVAGELGCTYGSVYLSLTGFRTMDNAGTMQLATLGRFLNQRGFKMWDLGMDMEYKRALGSRLVQRKKFLTIHRKFRDESLHSIDLFGLVDCSTFLKISQKEEEEEEEDDDGGDWDDNERTVA